MRHHPAMFRVRQTFDATRVDDVQRATRDELARLALQRRIRPGQSVAITAGSRGIANIAAILRAAAEHLQSLGAKPFLVPAMGSHGGATAEGQLAVLASLGVTPEACGCPIRSGMETVEVFRAAEGFAARCDRLAFEADHVLLCGRIKPHTDFAGEIESGLMKMMLIGLGNHEGAKIYHRAIQDYGFERIVRSVAPGLLAGCRVAGGLAIVENGYDQTARIAALDPATIIDREKELLALARRLLPRLPFPRVDLLLIDRIGKDISGTGMDTNVVGRKFNEHEALEDEWPKVRRIAVRGLSPGAGGNATGIGVAEFCTTRLVEQTDWPKTRLNCLTSGRIAVGMAPFDFPTDEAMITAALGTIGLVEPAAARALWIRDTLRLDEVECSAAYWDEAAKRDDLEVLTKPRPLPLDADGNLPEEGMLAMSPGSAAP